MTGQIVAPSILASLPATSTNTNPQTDSVFFIGRTFQRILSALLVKAIILSSLVIPTQQAHALPGEYNPPFRDHCSIVDCAFTYPVPVENWQEVATLNNPQGARGRVDGRSLYSGEAWMNRGQEGAGIYGLHSADVVLKAWQGQLESPPWIVARFVPETAELRISVLKTIKTPDGVQRVLAADYTPQHGRYHVVRRSFLTDSEKRSSYTRGQDPFLRFSGAPTDPTFYNMTTGAAQVAVGRAMSHYSAPYAFFIETSLRLDQKQTASGNLLKKKITTTTTGFVKPKIYLAAPLTMTAGRNNVTPAMMAVICPRATSCTHADQLAFSGFILEPLEGGNIASIEEEVYRDVQSKTSFTGVAFALLTSALTFGAGAIIAGSASWGVAGGSIVAAGAGGMLGAGAIAGTTVAAAAGMGYAGLSALIQGGPINSTQQSWLGEMGMTAEQVSYGTSDGSSCDTSHCQALYAQASSRHVQSGSLGTAQSSRNLQGTQTFMEGSCPVSLTAAQCLASGLNPGQMPRADTHTNRAYNAEVYERKRQACNNAGYGSSQQALYRCMAASLVIDNSDGEQ